MCLQDDANVCLECKTDKYGVQYNEKCSLHCDIDGCVKDTGRCHRSKDRYYGNFCENACSNCQTGTTCVNEYCQLGCIEGFSGQLCLSKCTDRSASCQQFDTSICITCKLGKVYVCTLDLLIPIQSS